MEYYGIIYKRTNIINGKFYYGQTTGTEQARWSRHCRDAKNGCSFLLHRAIRKYGPENFIGEVIEKCDNKEHLDRREIFYIAKDKSNDLDIGYNMVSGGEGGARHFSQETIEKIRKAATGRKFSQESKDKKSKSLTGRKLSAEHIEKLKIAKTGKKHKFKNKFLTADGKRYFSPEHRKKLSLAAIGNKHAVKLK